MYFPSPNLIRGGSVRSEESEDDGMAIEGGGESEEELENDEVVDESAEVRCPDTATMKVSLLI